MDASPTWIADAGSSRQATGARWAAFGPYYAMFPVAFARGVIRDYTQIGDGVLDPFAGRGTSLYCAQEASRHALGVEINPLGWIYGSTKLSPAPVEKVVRRIEEIGKEASRFGWQAEQLPDFFHYCFSLEVLKFLVASRLLLKWKSSRIDRTAMGFILTYLHGKIEHGKPSALSNQMRQTKAMAPDYSIRWWSERGMTEPPRLDPVSFLIERVTWRYAKGAPNWDEEALRFGDCRTVLPRRRESDVARYKLLLTSPPYCGVTSYYYDQWLRFWLLGDTERPVRDGKSWKTKFENASVYGELLKKSFGACRRLLSDDSVVYVRTDARPSTLDITKKILGDVFKEKSLKCVPAPYSRATQTHLFGDKADKPGEMDIILMP